MPAPELLLALLRARGPSGREDDAAHVWQEAARAFAEVSSDSLGSSVARVGGGDGPLLAIVGHIDEIGLVVTHIDDQGRVFFRSLGGWSPEVLVGQRVELLTQQGLVPALVARKVPDPLARGEEPKRTRLDDLYLEVGARDRKDALTVMRPGDVGVLAGEPLELRGSLLASRALDNRVGAYVALEVARRVSDSGAAAEVAAVAAVGEEAGDFSGARTALYALEPDAAVVVDVTPATDVPGGDPTRRGALALGGGPAIARGLPLNPRIADLLFETAEAEGIQVATEVYTGTTDTEADAVHLSRAGVPTGLVSIPQRNTHTPNELVDLADVEACVRLLVAFTLRGVG